MAITPNTNVRLLKLPLYLDNKNQITFQNATKQFEYFNSLDYLEIEHCSYQRKDGIIRFPAHIDNIITYNYVMYQNSNYGNKWFYAYITKMEYDNNNMTKIYITTDVFQTWQFQLTYLESFVEREMLSVAEDIPGANLIPEGLETGEFKVNGTAEINGLKPYYIVAYGRNPKDDGFTQETPAGQGMIVNGVASGMYYCVCNNETIQGLLSTINSAGYGESIIAIFCVPALAIVGFNGWTLDSLMSDEPLLWWMVRDFKANPIDLNMITRPNNLDSYVPRNQKLLTYPYIYLGFNPTNGNEKIYRYENFSNATPSFKIMSEINPNPTILFIPQNYRGATNNSMSDIAMVNGYPQISWVTDYFNTWLAQNSQIINIQKEQEQYNYEHNQSMFMGTEIANALTSMNITSPLSAVGAGTNLGFATEKYQMNAQNHGYYIRNLMAQQEKQEMLPNTSHIGTSATLLGYDLINDNIFTRYTIKRQFAERIDKYFDMYGYQTNTRKIPAINNRPKWNYVKTEGINIRAFIPQEDLQIIKNMFDSGITLWHDTNTFLDYSQNNRA